MNWSIDFFYLYRNELVRKGSNLIVINEPPGMFGSKVLKEIIVIMSIQQKYVINCVIFFIIINVGAFNENKSIIQVDQFKVIFLFFYTKINKAFQIACIYRNLFLFWIGCLVVVTSNDELFGLIICG